MAEKIGSMYIDFKADVADLKHALTEVKTQLKDMSHETQRSIGSFDLLGSVMTTSVIVAAIAGATAVINFTKSLVDFASASPDAQIAMADYNEQLRIMGEELGPETGKVIESFTALLKHMWVDAGPDLKKFLTWSAEFLTSLTKVWDFLMDIKDLLGFGDKEKEYKGIFNIFPESTKEEKIISEVEEAAEKGGLALTYTLFEVLTRLSEAIEKEKEDKKEGGETP